MREQNTKEQNVKEHNMKEQNMTELNVRKDNMTDHDRGEQVGLECYRTVQNGQNQR